MTVQSKSKEGGQVTSRVTTPIIASGEMYISEGYAPLPTVQNVWTTGELHFSLILHKRNASFISLGSAGSRHFIRLQEQYKISPGHPHAHGRPEVGTCTHPFRQPTSERLVREALPAYSHSNP